jgi:redox-sensitive bicupin YhaK (pirin superfamily)
MSPRPQPPHLASDEDPTAGALPATVERVVVPRTSDLGDGFTVRRALPSIGRRMVGPFVFFDEMGPVVLAPGKGLDVRPHPHIGLATVTYLFSGEILHRDSLGHVQPIRPGEVNWMTAGRGIAHSERSPAEARAAGPELHGIQVWVALPAAAEEIEPSFVHHGREALPLVEGDGARMTLVLGALHGRRSPVATASETFYADVVLAPGARFVLPAEHEERAAYLVEGELAVDGEEPAFEPGRLLIFRPREPIVLRAGRTSARVILLGGAALDGPRHVWWNFVSSRPERIEQAKADWRAGRLGVVPGETEFIPLPEEPPPPVRYP